MSIFTDTTPYGYAIINAKTFALLWASSSSCKEVEDKINRAHNKEFGCDFADGNVPWTRSLKCTSKEEQLGKYIRNKAYALMCKGVKLTKYSDWHTPAKPNPLKLDIDAINLEMEAFHRTREAYVDSLPLEVQEFA